MSAALQLSTELLAAVPPFLAPAVAALLLFVLPRTAGHAVAALATLFALAQSQFVADGAYLPTRFLGFDVLLFNVDDFSRLVGLVVAVLATAAVVYSWSTEARKVQTGFAMAYVASTLGTVYAGDWLTVIFFWELMAVTSTLLVWHYGGAAVRAGYRYALIHGAGGTVFLAAVVFHYVEAGSFLFADATGIAAGPATLLTALGVGVNCGFIGLHMWLPDTYPRPHVAASVFLSVFTTKTAVYVMARAFPEGGLWLAYMGGAMAVYGVFFALLQYDPRRLLSYHIQAQVGYMLAGLGLASSVGGVAVAGGMAHLFNNVLYKALLFMAVGVVVYRTGVQNIKRLGGLWKVMPLTFLAYVLGAASITAVPGFNGFISKGMVIDAAHEIEYYPLLLGEDLLWWMLILGGVGTFMSFVKLGWYIFFHGEAEVEPDDANPGQTVAMLSIGGLCLYYGLFPEALFDLLPFAEEWASHAHPYSTGHLKEGVTLAVVGFVGFFALKNALARISHLPDLDRVVFPASFYAGKGLVYAVTESYAAVDRAVMGTVGAAKRAGGDPQGYARRLSGAPDLRLETGIGRGVLVLTVVTAFALVLLLVV